MPSSFFYHQRRGGRRKKTALESDSFPPTAEECRKDHSWRCRTQMSVKRRENIITSAHGLQARYVKILFRFNSVGARCGLYSRWSKTSCPKPQSWSKYTTKFLWDFWLREKKMPPLLCKIISLWHHLQYVFAYIHLLIVKELHEGWKFYVKSLCSFIYVFFWRLIIWWKSHFIALFMIPYHKWQSRHAFFLMCACIIISQS